MPPSPWLSALRETSTYLTVVSVFNGRIVFSNPGQSLVPKERTLNAQPESRNSALAGLLRQMHLCEAVSYTHLDVYKRQVLERSTVTVSSAPASAA